jgi:hypothetical protein
MAPQYGAADTCHLAVVTGRGSQGTRLTTGHTVTDVCFPESYATSLDGGTGDLGGSQIFMAERKARQPGP